MLLAVADIVFEMGTFGFQHIECLVLDLPAGPTAGSEFSDIVGANRKIGIEAVAIGHPSRSGTSWIQR